MTLTDRELASVVLFIVLGVVALVSLARTRGRGAVAKSSGAVVRNALKPKIVAVILGLIVWTTFVVAFAWRLGWWDLGLLKDTVVTTAAAGFPLVGFATQAETLRALVNRVVAGSLGLGALVTAYINLESFPFTVELVVQPLAVFLIALWVLSGSDPKYTRLRLILTGVLGFGVLSVALWTSVRLFAAFGERDWGSDVATFLLAAWLLLLMLPYVYFIAVVSRIEVILIRVNHRVPSPLRVKIALAVGTRFSLRLLARFNGRNPRQLGDAKTLGAAFAIMRNFREEVEREDERLRLRAEHEAQLVGVRGVDHNGAQLDRSEFQVTKDRLQWIWTSQVGRYAGNGSRYWDDLTDIMVGAERYGLPEDHGFVTEVTPDGQQWRSWRAMPSGSYLGIGGANGEAKDYFFGGPARPVTWPLGVDTEWTGVFESRPPDWQHYDGPHR